MRNQSENLSHREKKLHHKPMVIDILVSFNIIGHMVEYGHNFYPFFYFSPR